MSSLRSGTPARTPSRTSRAFRNDRNDFSPFNSLAELKAATASPSLHPPPPRGSDMYAGSDRGRTPLGRAPSNLPPPEEDDMGSFYGDEPVDYGRVQPSHLNPGEGHFAQYAGSSRTRSRQPSPTRSQSSLGSPHPPFARDDFPVPSHDIAIGSRAPSSAGQHRGHLRQPASHVGSLRPSVAGSQHPSRGGTGWGSRAPSSGGQRVLTGSPDSYGKHGVHHAYDYEDEFLPPDPPGPQKWMGSHPGTANGSERHIPKISVEGPYHDQLSARSVSPAITHPVMRAKSSRASIHYDSQPVASGSGMHHYDDDDGELDGHPLLSRSKSTRSSMRRPPLARNPSSRPSRASIASIIQSGGLPAWCERDGDNVVVQVWLPWTERLKEMPCRFHVEGWDKTVHKLEVDYQWTKMVRGSAKFRGAGLRRKGGGKGHLIIEWEIFFDDDEGSSSD